MTTMRNSRRTTIFLFLLLSGTASAQLTITNVVNAGSRSPNIAQGALFVVSARGIGPAEIQQASFPLPTIEGLAGVTIQAIVGGATVDAIMVYVAPNEAAAILPSQTPIGTGTVRVNSNIGSATAPIRVVAANFGFFTIRPGFPAPALAFNVSADDGSTTQNTGAQSAQPGQDVLISGTGLGAISSDETQSGVTDVPSTAIKLYVGMNPAAVISAGRGACCDGLDPSYRIPQGIAAWDVIRFTIPDGVVGCYIPVAVQIGTLVSNLSTISIAPNGGDCTPAVNTLPPGLLQQLAGKTGVSLGVVNLGRGTGINATPAGVIRTTTGDSGSAVFIRYPNLPVSMVAADYIYPENVCQINGYPGPNGGAVVNGMEAPIIPQAAVPLDAGPAITVTGPSGTRTITKRTFGMLFDYPGVTFGDTTPRNYFDPGHYTVTGTGGKDVGAFTASMDVPPTPFIWTNIPSVTTPIDRSKDLTVTWTGGIPGTQVTLVGASAVNGVTAAFLCAAPVSAGQMTVPAYVTLTLSPTGSSVVPGGLVLGNASVTTFTASGLDIASIAFGARYSLSLKFE